MKKPTQLTTNLFYYGKIEDGRKVYVLINKGRKTKKEFYDKDSFIAELELNYGFNAETGKFVDIADVIDAIEEPEAEIHF